MSKSTSLFLTGLLIGTVLASALFAWLGKRKPTGAGASKLLRVAHSLPTAHPVHQGIMFMADRVGELSGGRLKLEVFPNEQLGNETQALEQTQAGTLAITKVSCGVVGSFVSLYNVFSLPYLFADEAHLWRVLDGDIGKELLERLTVGNDSRPSGLTGLCFYDAGSRSFYTKVPVRSPEDIRGKKIRTMNDPVAMDIINTMGGAATPIPWGELYTSLQQGVVDGAENNAPSLLTSRHFEVCKYYTLDHHTRLPDVLVISSKVWKRLSPEEQAWVRKAADESSDFQRKLWAEENEKALAQLREAGVQISTVDLETFRKASAPVLEKYSTGLLKTLVERIRAAR